MTSPKQQSPSDHRAGAAPLSRLRDTGASNNDSDSIVRRAVAGDIAVFEVETAAVVQARRRRARRFLKGPIPLDDLARAARLPGQALTVYLAVHHRMALTREKRVRLPHALMLEFGVTKDAKARALRQLEAAGLVRVERRTGRSAVITLHGRAQDGVGSGPRTDSAASPKAGGNSLSSSTAP